MNFSDPFLFEQETEKFKLFIYIRVDYSKLYDELIEFRKTNIPQGYVENHHILPKSLGGSDDINNLVRLTAREHYVAHLFLHKIHKTKETAFALWMMQCKSTNQDDRPHIKNSRMYEWARLEFKKYFKNTWAKGKSNSQYGTRWICNLELKENKKISKEEEIPEGWVKGRNLWNSYNECDTCGRKVDYRSKCCRSCATKEQRKKSRKFETPKEDLIRYICYEKMSFDRIGKIYGCSGNSIRKRAKKVGIDYKNRKF